MVAESFAVAPTERTYTVFVTNDRHLHLWCRLHLTALTPEAAHAELDARRSLKRGAARDTG